MQEDHTFTYSICPIYRRIQLCSGLSAPFLRHNRILLVRIPAAGRPLCASPLRYKGESVQDPGCRPFCQSTCHIGPWSHGSTGTLPYACRSSGNLRPGLRRHSCMPCRQKHRKDQDSRHRQDLGRLSRLPCHRVCACALHLRLLSLQSFCSSSGCHTYRALPCKRLRPPAYPAGHRPSFCADVDP